MDETVMMIFKAWAAAGGSLMAVINDVSSTHLDSLVALSFKHYPSPKAQPVVVAMVATSESRRTRKQGDSHARRRARSSRFEVRWTPGHDRGEVRYGKVRSCRARVETSAQAKAGQASSDQVERPAAVSLFATPSNAFLTRL
jgi:hypothetical protein